LGRKTGQTSGPLGVTLVFAPAGSRKTTPVFALSCMDIIGGIIKIRIDKIIQGLTSKF
jgi:hypothetical protein